MLPTYDSVFSPIGSDTEDLFGKDFSALDKAELEKMKTDCFAELEKLRAEEPSTKRKNVSAYHVLESQVQEKLRELRAIRNEFQRKNSVENM